MIQLELRLIRMRDMNWESGSMETWLWTANFGKTWGKSNPDPILETLWQTQNFRFEILVKFEGNLTPWLDPRLTGGDGLTPQTWISLCQLSSLKTILTIRDHIFDDLEVSHPHLMVVVVVVVVEN